MYSSDHYNLMMLLILCGLINSCMMLLLIGDIRTNIDKLMWEAAVIIKL